MVTRQYLIEERKSRQWSQQKVADLVGTTQNNVSRWELGITTPSPYFRTKLCKLFGKGAQELGLLESDSLPTIPGEREAAEAGHTLSSPAEVFALWTVPYPRNPHFTGREELLTLLDQCLSPVELRTSTGTRRAALTQPQAIKGLGGIGKTQIAVEYAYRAREQGQYTHILWVNTASEDTILTSLGNLAELLPSFSAKEEKDQGKLVAAIKRWLEYCEQRWLLIFDNADHQPLMQEYAPNQGNGSLLLTTRAQAVGSLASSIEVENMGLVEGTQLLLHRAQRQQVCDEEYNEAVNVAIALDGFPLALDQAGAYIEETGCNFEEYLQLYQDHRKALLARRGTQMTNYPESVATTWSLSLHKIEQANPAAVELLRLCAFLEPDQIPEELLKDSTPHWPPILQEATSDLLAFNQMLEELLSFSLVKRLKDEQMLSIHRLVQVVQRDAISPEEQCLWAERVVRATDAIFPRDPKEDVASWPLCLRYLAQAQACDTLIHQHSLLLPEAADLLNRAGIYLHEHASYAIAEPLFQRAIQIWEQQPGPEASQFAHTLNNLANLHRQQRKYAEAEPLYQRALRIWQQQLGSEHSDVASALNNLAVLYHEQGKYTKAEPLYQRALRIREQQLGREHPDVAYTLNNLGVLSHEQGKYTEAESFYQQALRIREQQLGAEHLLIAYPLVNLANLYRDQSKDAQAEIFYQRALGIRERQLGPNHSLIAYPLTGLANLYRVQGHYEKAEPLYERALSIRERALEANHPSIAETLQGFAALRKAQNKLQEAIPLYRWALVICKQAYGLHHPKTIEAREQLQATLLILDREKKTRRIDVTQPE